MKKIFLIIFFSSLFLLGWSQVTTVPAFITQTGGPFDIIFDASQGSAGLAEYTSDVYAHIGVITSTSASSSDWKYVLTPWPASATDTKANTTKNKLVSLGNDKWKLTVSPNIKDFLGIPTTETIKQIALVFRNADGSKTGKTAAGGDIFIDVSQGGFSVKFVTPADGSVAINTLVPVEIAASDSSLIRFKINGTEITNLSKDKFLKTNYTFTSTGDYTLIAEGIYNGITKSDTVYLVVPADPVLEARPQGVLPGINYIDSKTVTLVLHAPKKTNVFLIGEMNDWRQLNAYQLKKDGEYWWITLTDLTPQKIYAFQYLVDGKIKISDPYTEMVLDPWNDKYISSTIYPNLKPYPNGKTTGIVATFQTSKPAYNWEVKNFTMPAKENMIIYEMLLRDFTKEKTLKAAIDRLDYLKTLGINAIELMPVTEFDGNLSWGYNPNHFFAADKAYGDPDTYKKFIDECHKRGIAVILDMVFNHATGASPFAMLFWDSVNNRPAADNPWMNVSAPHPYSVFNDFNHTYTGTREHFKRSLQYWIREYKVDGFRMDLTKGLTQTPSTESTAGSYDQSRIDNITAYYEAAKTAKPDVMFILEHFCSNSEELELAGKGMYLWRNINNAFSQAAMGYKDQSDFSGLVVTPRNWVGYAESHDEERNFYKVKKWGAGDLTTDSVAMLKRVPLNIAFVALTAGPKMFWQFEEMGYDYSINDFGGRVNEKPSVWEWYNNLPLRKAAAHNAAKVINLRTQYPAAFSEGVFTYNISGSDWPIRKITLNHSSLNMVAVGNFDASATVQATLGFPSVGIWYNLMNGSKLEVTNTAMTVSMKPGDLNVYTDREIALPEIIKDSVRNTIADYIFPAITKDIVYINSTLPIENIKVYTPDGKLLLTLKNASEVNLSSYRTGIYLLQVITSEQKKTYKVIKQ